MVADWLEQLGDGNRLVRAIGVADWLEQLGRMVAN